MKTQKITIIGLGLIGGSLAMALKKKRAPVKITGTSRRASTVKLALRRRIVDKGEIDHKRAVRGADIVIVCTPINKIIPILKEISPSLKPGAIVTDVGSTKAKIVREAEKVVPKRAYFIGGHPMAGRELTGLDAAEAGLFDGKPYILTTTKKTDKKALARLESLLKKLNVKILKLSPERQDLLVAGISHLPLAVASSLVNAISSSRDKGDFASVASSGFCDTTRIASGDPLLGVDLFTTNRIAVLAMIKLFRDSLSELEGKIRSGKSTKGFLERAKKFRDRVYKK